MSEESYLSETQEISTAEAKNFQIAAGLENATATMLNGIEGDKRLNNLQKQKIMKCLTEINKNLYKIQQNIDLENSTKNFNDNLSEFNNIKFNLNINTKRHIVKFCVAALILSTMMMGLFGGAFATPIFIPVYVGFLIVLTVGIAIYGPKKALENLTIFFKGGTKEAMDDFAKTVVLVARGDKVEAFPLPAKALQVTLNSIQKKQV